MIWIAITVIVSLLTPALSARAQSAYAPSISLRPVIGALVAVGSQHDAMKNSVIVGAQASYTLDPSFSVLGTLAWSPSQDMQTARQPAMDVYQYDVGLAGRLDDVTRGSVAVTRPYAAVGVGGRTYRPRQAVSGDVQTNPLLYSALGIELDHTSGMMGLRLEVRDNITAFKGFHGEFADRTARHDLQFSAGLTLGL